MRHGGGGRAAEAGAAPRRWCVLRVCVPHLLRLGGSQRRDEQQRQQSGTSSTHGHGRAHGGRRRRDRQTDHVRLRLAAVTVVGGGLCVWMASCQRWMLLCSVFANSYALVDAASGHSDNARRSPTTSRRTATGCLDGLRVGCSDATDAATSSQHTGMDAAANDVAGWLCADEFARARAGLALSFLCSLSLSRPVCLSASSVPACRHAPTHKGTQNAAH